MKATVLLERQHRNLQQLCEAVERGSESIRASLLPQLAGDLLAHIAIEEQLFYPAVDSAFGDDLWARSARSWHRAARATLEHAMAVPFGSDDFERVIGELRLAVELHAEEVEEVLGPALERALGDDLLRQLGVSMLALHHVKLEMGYVREVRVVEEPPPATR